MRFFLVAAVALVALVSSSAVDETSVKSVHALDDNIARSLRSTNTDNKEERAIADLLEGEDRAVFTANYGTWYRAKVTPSEVKAVLGFTQHEMTKIARELQRLYLGYYSYYTARKKQEQKEKELEKP